MTGADPDQQLPRIAVLQVDGHTFWRDAHGWWVVTDPHAALGITDTADIAVLNELTELRNPS
ncbi:MAG: hypothetical protein R2695_04010 [Acidimicrobiales bacterium]